MTLVLQIYQDLARSKEGGFLVTIALPTDTTKNITFSTHGYGKKNIVLHFTISLVISAEKSNIGISTVSYSQQSIIISLS